MTDSPAVSPSSTATITIPSSVQMTILLGPNDEIIRTIEALVPAVDIHVRGNEITLHGPAADVGLVDQLLAELLIVLRTGQGLAVDTVER